MAPVTTLQKIITLAQKQYGIRFQVTTDQLVDFVNTIQYIAFNQDLDAFIDRNQIFFLGYDVFLVTEGSYVSPVDSDIGLSVSGSSSGVVGKLMNYKTQNRVNKWIIEPPDAFTSFTLVDGETLTIVGGSSATATVVAGQTLEVSNGPYKMPGVYDTNPPFRKLIGVSQLSDEQIFNVPPSTSFRYTDYGLPLNDLPGSRSQNYPFKYDQTAEEITLITSSRPEIIQSELAVGPSSTTINTSKLRWIYYINPPALTSINDEANLIIPERYRYEVLYKGISKLADTAVYGDMESVRQIIEPLCERFWEDARQQFQSYGLSSDWISEPDSDNSYWGWGSLGRYW